MDSAARHACHCGKSFARKEHLTRHQATHDKLGHICNVCQRRFSRKDLLRRHSIVHEASHTRVFVSCDVCHANKTKCSGGIPCLLCTRRGIECTFRRALHSLYGASTGDDSTAINAPVSADDDDDNNDKNDNDNREPMLRTISSLPTLLEANNEFLLNLEVVPSRSAPASEVSTLSPGMEGVFELLAAEKPSLEHALGKSVGLQEWVDKCQEAYFKNFHLQWPIFNAPSLDIRRVSLPLAASICVIGSWLQENPNWTEKFYALRVHEILLQHLLHQLNHPESILEGQKWPIETFQAVLSTLIFTFCRNDKSAIFRATVLRSTFITILRELGAFNASTLEDHLKTYFNGPYAPYALSMREQFKRLLVLTYQFDAYFALAHEKPPLLHRQEIGVDLPSSFALWNAYGLDVFAKRQSEEPTGRAEFKVSEMTNSPASLTSSQLLAEDVQLGLCGLLQTIWVLTPSFPLKTTEQLGDSLLIEKLDAWKYELDKINELAKSGNINSHAVRNLLLAYRGEDDSVAASLERINTLVKDGIILYYYLKIYHYTGLDGSQVVGVSKRIQDPRMHTWRTSRHGREALVCALQILKLFEMNEAPGQSLNPLVRHALTISFNVTKVLVSCRKSCLTSEALHAATTNLRQWTEIGGPLTFDDIPVCVCKLQSWIERFEKVIQDQKIMVEDC